MPGIDPNEALPIPFDNPIHFTAYDAMSAYATQCTWQIIETRS